ncbi:MAG: AAA family ATPase, partial [Gemmatimonadota bacterium]
MIERTAMAGLQDALDHFPVVVLSGPRQVGKTTLALALAERLGAERVRYLDLDSPADRARLADPAEYLESQTGRL